MAKPLVGALPGFVQEKSGSVDEGYGQSSCTLPGPVRQDSKGKRPKTTSTATRSKRATAPAGYARHDGEVYRHALAHRRYDARQEYEDSCRRANKVLRARLRIVKALRARCGEATR